MRKSLTGLCLGLIGILLILNLIPFSSSDEWVYTLKWLNLICSSIAGILILVLIWSPWRIICLAGASACILGACLAPFTQNLDWKWQYVLSACWASAFILVSLALFSLGKAVKGLRSWLACGAASFALAIAVLELFYLFSPQASDGISNLSSQSRHASSQGKPETESWSDFQCGKILSPGSGKTQVFHRVVKFGDDLFDAVYNFNELGFRQMPVAAAPEKNLMLFGCSMTFGHGLPEEQTWAWQLARKLGSSWQLENYAISSWSANQMLCMLEHGMIPAPPEKERYALFLAIADHLRRNDFFGATPHYELNEAGQPVQAGKARFDKIHNMVGTFNGSQLAREASSSLLGAIMKKPEPMLRLYLGLLKRSAQILRDKYQTQLYVLLWPDFEYARKDIETLGIPVIPALDFLPEWGNDGGRIYRIHPLYESHPNAKASTALATGLADYFKKLASQQAGTESGKNQSRTELP